MVACSSDISRCFSDFRCQPQFLTARESALAMANLSLRARPQSWSQQSQSPDGRLLRARRERPCRRAADERDELAPFHSITSSARASSIGGTLRPSARSWQIYCKYELGRLHHRQVSGLFAFDNSAGIDAGLSKRLRQLVP